jgi:hypothetical protein
VGGLDHVKMMMQLGDIFVWMLAYHPDLDAGSDFCVSFTLNDDEPCPIDVTRAEVEELVEALQEFLLISKEAMPAGEAS